MHDLCEAMVDYVFVFVKWGMWDYGALTLTLALSHDGRGDKRTHRRGRGGRRGELGENPVFVAWCCILLHFPMWAACPRSRGRTHRRGRGGRRGGLGENPVFVAWCCILLHFPLWAARPRSRGRTHRRGRGGRSGELGKSPVFCDILGHFGTFPLWVVPLLCVSPATGERFLGVAYSLTFVDIP